MRTIDVVGSAIGNTFRSRTRTILTILAIFIGSFTLTITTGLGTGINAYIDDTVASIGGSDTMSVTKTAADAPTGDGPREYDPNVVTAGDGPMQATVQLMGPADIEALEQVDGVLAADPVLAVDLDWVRAASDSDGTRFEAEAAGIFGGAQLQLAAGFQPDAASSELQVAIPVAYVDALGFADADAALGETVTLGLADGLRAEQQVEAVVVGVAEASLGGTGTSMITNDALTTRLSDVQSVGLPDAASDQYGAASIRFDPSSTPTGITDLQERLTESGFTGTTVAEQLGSFKTVIDAIVLVLNAFAIIALLAAGFGIVNTLFMSVQERTREIGLMKAMGMGSGKVFGLFSTEATFIGFLGSAIGVGVGMIAGSLVGQALGAALFADLPGLVLISFDVLSVGGVVLLVMAIAFLAGTLPALRAARQDPIESLRYE